MKNFFPTKDFAASLIASSAPGTGGTTFNVTTGEGTKFPNPATLGPFRAYVWPNGVDPTTTNCEEVEVTAISTDALTVVRSKNGVSLNVQIGYQFSINFGKSREDQLKNTIPLYSIARQALINGNFDVWQRATTKTGPTHNTYPAADRWRFNMAVDGGTDPTMIISQQALTPGDIDGSFYFHRLNVNGAGSSYGSNSFHTLSQSIEHGVRHLCGAGRKVTIRFKARSSIGSKKLGVSLSQYYGSTGSPSGIETIIGQKFTLTSTWTEYTLTLDTNTLVGKTFGTDNNDALVLEFWFQYGASYQATVGDSTPETFVGSGNIDIAQVQVCSGDVPLEFYPRSYNEELALCERYYYRDNAGDKYTAFGSGFCATTSAAFVNIQYPKRMRVIPTFGYGGNVAITDKTGTSVPPTSLAQWVDADSYRGSTLTVGVSGTPLVAGDATFLRADNDATAYLEFDAEM